jgi:hypothetical protein
MMVMRGIDEIVDMTISLLVGEAVNYILTDGHLFKVIEISEKVNYILMKRNQLKTQVGVVQRGGGSMRGLNIPD